MTNSHSRASTAALLAILALSGGIMVWLFWHYPVFTTLATLTILVGLGLCARLARLTDTDMADLHREQRF